VNIHIRACSTLASCYHLVHAAAFMLPKEWFIEYYPASCVVLEVFFNTLRLCALHTEAQAVCSDRVGQHQSSKLSQTY